jgi:hypothetical protein
MATADKDLAKLSVQLELQTAAFEAGVKRMDGQLKRMDKNTKRSSKGLDKLNATLGKLGISLGALAGAFSIQAVTNLTKEAIAFGDSIDKVSQKVGVSAEELQELRFAASQSGVDVRQLDMGIQRFARRMGEAAKGTGELLKTTQELGIVFKNADGTNKSTVELLEQYAEAVGRATTQQEKLRLAFKAFDSEGAALVNLIGNGSAAMKEFAAEARRAGIIMGEGTVKAAANLTDEMDRLEKIVSTKVNTAVIRFTASVLDLFGALDGEGQMALALSRIEQFEDKLRAAQEAGDEDGIANAIELITKWSQTYYDLRMEYGDFADTVNNTVITPKIDQDASLKKFADVVKEIEMAKDPFYEYEQRILRIQEATLAGAIGPTEMAAAIARVTEEAYYALDPVGQFEAKVNKFVEGLNAEANDTAEQLGIMYAALKLVTDPALIAQIEKQIAALEGFTPDPEPIENYAGVAQEALEKIQDAADGFISDFTTELVDGLAEGELAFDDFAKSVLKTIAKIVLNEIFTQFFTAVSGNLFPKAAGVELPETVTASIAQGQGGMTRAGEQATAMTVGRLVSNQSASSGNTSPVTVNVNNYGNDDVSVTERQDSNGGIEIDVLIKNTVRNGFAGGDFDKVMSSTFGARRLGY